MNKLVFGIGMQKAGTSWLYYLLSNARNYCLPLIKEIHYFDNQSLPFRLHKTARNLNTSFKSDATLKHKAYLTASNICNKGYVNYLKYLSQLNFNTADITPSYSILGSSTLDSANSLLKSYFHVIPILLLRNPVDRVLSAFQMYLRDSNNIHCKDTRIEPTFQQFLSLKRVLQRSNVIMSVYNYIKVFDNIEGIFYYEDLLVNKKKSELSRLNKYLALDLPLSIDSYCTQFVNKNTNPLPCYNKLRVIAEKYVYDRLEYSHVKLLKNVNYIPESWN